MTRGQGFRGSPRGGFNDQAKGRGIRGRGRGRGRGGRGRATGYDDDLDFVLQFREERSDVRSPGPHFHGGRGGYNRGFASPRGRGAPNIPSSRFRPITSIASTFRGRGGDASFTRGRGRGSDTSTSAQGRKKVFNRNAPLSKLLYEDRPYLRPVIFVRSTQTPRLFEAEEEIFETMNEEESGTGEHVPTADKVFQLFHYDARKGEEEGIASEELEEIDFEDVGKIQEEVDRIATGIQDIKVGETAQVVEEETFAGVKRETEVGEGTLAEVASTVVDATNTPTVEVAEMSADAAGDVNSLGTSQGRISTRACKAGDEAPDLSVEAHTANEEVSIVYEAVPVDSSLGDEMGVQASAPAVSESAEQIQPLGFYVDTGPVGGDSGPTEAVTYTTVEAPVPLGEKLHEDDEDIVYAAPQQVEGPGPDEASTSRLSSRPPSPSALPAPSFSSVSFSFGDTPSRTQQRRYANRPKSLLDNRQTKHRKRGGSKAATGLFGSFGAAREERELWGTVDPRRDERRKDDDVLWGDEIESESEEDDGDMQVDVDVDLNVMRRFVDSMGPRSEHLGAGDLEDLERMKVEDEGAGDESSNDDTDEEEAQIFDEEERVMIAEAPVSEQDEDDDEDEEGEDDDDGSDIDESPRRGFQARLERLRNASKGKQIVNDPMSLLETVSDDDVAVDYLAWSDDEELVVTVQAFVDGNDDVLNGRRNRKDRNKLFKAIQDGKFDELEKFGPAKRSKDKGKDLPPELQEQWQRDRAKKAEYKRQREQTRLEAAADPMVRKKGGKKGRKAMRAAARLDPSVEISNRIVDMISLETQIRRFIADIGGVQTMVLPPCDKGTRKTVHELAVAFNLSSKSKGSEANRYITLAKTTKTGPYVNEKKVKKIMRRFKSDYGAGDSWGVPGSKGKSQAHLPKHREGDEVGKAAPKIDSSNVGFRMLAGMGWSDGDRIGLSGGLDAPLAAVFKQTKLGLGATL